MLDFADQLVIVTGGTRGIGRAISTAFLARGARVMASYVENREAAERFRSEVEGQDRLTLSCFDVSSHAAVERFFDQLPAPPRVLVNNAGIRRDGIAGMTTEEDWRRVLAVNLDGTFYMTKFAVRVMSRQRYGRIINVTSPSAELGIKGQGSYAASKAGQTALARVVAGEVATRGITVNCVEPGFVDTDLLADLSPETRQVYERLVPMGRFGTAAEVAGAVLYLASAEASYVTGTTLRVAGGL